VVEQYLPWLARTTKRVYRLPTEAEWELASRGRPPRIAEEVNAETAPCEIGNFAEPGGEATAPGSCAEAFAGTAPVGSFRANSLGIFDLSGNVWEWTVDCPRGGFSLDASKNPMDCDVRVLKGGSWASEANAARPSGRGWEKPEKRKNSIGFRLVRSLE
jgi:formylglycine-generating enzyme required for sulfatase activity